MKIMTKDTQINKPVLVLLHGWGVNQGVWQAVKTELTDQITVLTPDLPGFGTSTVFPQNYSLSAVTAQLAQQIPDNALLCGWSLGGLLAIALAADYPHKVQRLALIASSPRFLAKPDWPGMSPDVMKKFAEALQHNLPQTVERFLAIQAMGSQSAKTDTKTLKQAIMAYPEADPVALQGGLALLSEQDLSGKFSRLSIPVAGCFGRLDSLVPATVIPLLQQLQPSAEFTLLPKASHAPFVSHLPEFITWLNEWLDLDIAQ